jgi:AraC-like DNA-binding protein
MINVLSDILNTVELKGTLYFRADFSPPFAIKVPDLGRAARFHLVVQGQLHVTLPDGVAIVLQAGDLILIPNGSTHVLAHAPGQDAPLLEEVLVRSGYDGTGTLVIGDRDPAASPQLVCGHFNCADGADHPLFRALPAALHITAADRAQRPMLDDVLRLLARRVFEDAPGSFESVARLSEVLFIEILRVGVDRAPDLERLLSAISDPQIGRALGLIHHRPEEDWTVDSLASAVGMSRSRFADRFRELVGTGPMTYVTDWRMQRALALLRDPRLSVQQVAQRTGYRSPAAFSRAFVQKFGRSPRADRRKAE